MFNPDKMKLKVNVGGVSKDIPQGELTRIVLGQDENGEDILGGYYTDYNEDMTPDLTKYESDTAVKELADWKVERQTAVDNIEVDYNGVIFQGDEKSQDRMSRAINGLPDDTTTIDWVAKDNSIHQLTRVDFRTILGMAGAIQASLWNNNRPTI